MNRVEIRGGLVRDAELKFLGERGTPCLEFTVAVNGTRYDAQSRQQVVKTTFVAVQAWVTLAEETMERYEMAKGSEVYVVGELDQREIEKQDGTKERKTRVTAFHIGVVRGRSTYSSTGSRPAAPPADSGGPTDDPWAGPPPF